MESGFHKKYPFNWQLVLAERSDRQFGKLKLFFDWKIVNFCNFLASKAKCSKLISIFAEIVRIVILRINMEKGIGGNQSHFNYE